MTGQESDQPRIPPLDPPYGLAADLLAKVTRPGSEPLLIFRTLARHVALATAMEPLASYLLGPDGLAAEDRELAILRVTARCGCRSEWATHATVFAPLFGWPASLVRGLRVSAGPVSGLSDRQGLVVELCDGLVDHAAISDALWARLRYHWSDEELLELIVVVGLYQTVSYVAKCARTPVEAWASAVAGGEDQITHDR